MPKPRLEALLATTGTNTRVRADDAEAPRRVPARTYHPVEGYFDEVDTPEKAYILGFLLADGCVHERPACVSIELAERDRGHLETLRDILSPGQPLRPHRVSYREREITQYRLTIYSVHMVRALARWGVVPRKSLIATPPELPESLQPHMWRGIIDGDGTWTWSRSSGWRMELTGSLGVVEALRMFLITNGIDTSARVRPDRSAYRFALGGADLVRRSARLLYGDRSALALGRKASLAHALASLPGRFDAVQAATPEAVEFLRLRGFNWVEVAERLGISRMVLWRLRREWAGEVARA